MVRLGIHYIEPRRIGFFVLEQTALWLSFLLAAAAVEHGIGHGPPLPGLLIRALLATASIEAGLYLTNLHDLPTALDDARYGRRLLKVLGASWVLLGFAFAMGLGGRRVDPPSVAGLSAACLVALALRSALPGLTGRLGLRTRIFLVGEGAAARLLMREIARDGNVEIAGFGSPRTRHLPARAQAAGAEAIVVVSDDDGHGLPTEELLACRAEGLDVIEGAAFAARALHRLPVDLVRPRDLIFHDGFARPLWLRIARRAMSVAVSALLLALASPLLLAAVIAIRLDGKGPILFRQERVGRRGQVFSIFKLRTMSVDAEKSGARWAQKDDPRVTRVGRILRRYRIDELPQLWNVFVGDMDLVGPRPERPEFVAELKKKIPFYELRHLVRPGITGWAQVRYPYAASVEEAREKLQYDLYFVRHLSLSLDLLILLLTAKVVLGGRGAR